MDKYPFQEIEPKWQQYWDEHKTFRATEDARGRKCYVLDMFPYPSGAGLHVGHPEGYTATDIVCRYQRMRGFNVLHPMGWDAFGLPAEQYAIETGTHPAVTTARNIETFKRQIKRLGFSYDWDREINTTDPGYVKWTQWIFLTLYARGLAYMAEAPVWWCGDCGTVLANEEVVDGRCERKGHAVERRPMRQWMLKITAYAERLLADLDALDWPAHIKDMQRHWIGKSEGADVWFAVEPKAGPVPDAVVDGARVRRRGAAVELKIYTTRPDTLFGATYLVLAPEHPLVPSLPSRDRRELVEQYRATAARKSELERAGLAKEKTGVFTGAYAINPVNQERIPIWIADYVLASYGTGAIMAVPAHDQRDLEFALAFGLDVRLVILPEERPLELAGLTHAYTEPGRMHDSGPFTGLGSEDASGKIIAWLHSRGLGEPAVNYKLRDWLFSRQRYWGEPIPIVHCAACGTVPLPASALPLTLPPMEDFRPTGTAEPPLAKAAAWVQTRCPRCQGPARRETNTMPQWAGSCWYYLRYLDPRNDARAWDPAKERSWMPVDLYVGGAEHAVLHLLYARFWHKVLYDAGLVSTSEPFQRLVNQGLILGEDNEKMSKSRGNVVNPDDVIAAHGADAFRVYEMFLGPLEAVKPWSARSIEGVDRFLNRVWRLGELVARGSGLGALGQANVPIGSSLERKLHETIRRVTEDIETLRLNTAISAMMELVNAMYEERDSATVQPSAQSPQPRATFRDAFETLVLLLSPFAPHLGEELWQRLGHRESLALAPWPQADLAALRQEAIQLVVQVNGKVRARITVPADASEDELKSVILADAQVRKHVDGKPLKQFIVVPKRLVNIVVGLACCLLWWAVPGWTETIYLKSGQKIQAPITKRTEDGIVVDWYGVPITYWHEEIERIDEGAGAFPPSVSRAVDAPAALQAVVQEVLQASGFSDQLKAIPLQVQQQVEQRRHQLSPERAARVSQALTEAYQPEALEEAVATRFLQEADVERLQGLLAWLRSPLARTMTQLETHALTPEATAEIAQFLASLQGHPPSAERLALIERLSDTVGAARASWQVSVAVAEGVVRAVGAADAQAISQAAAALRQELDQMRAESLELYESQAMMHFLYVYHPVSDQDLRDYIAFWASEPGQWFNRLSTQALVDALAQAAELAARQVNDVMAPPTVAGGG